jgi:hypothetical protein
VLPRISSAPALRLLTVFGKRRMVTRDLQKKTYYSVGWTVHGSSSGMFWEVSMPGGAMRVMNKCVHQAALEIAGKKLRELSHGWGSKESSL